MDDDERDELAGHVLIITFVRKFFFSLTTFKMSCFHPNLSYGPVLHHIQKINGAQKIVQPIEIYLFLRYDKSFDLCAHNNLCT